MICRDILNFLVQISLLDTTMAVKKEGTVQTQCSEICISIQFWIYVAKIIELRQSNIFYFFLLHNIVWKYNWNYLLPIQKCSRCLTPPHQWFSPCTLVSSTNLLDLSWLIEVTEMLFKVVLNTHIFNNPIQKNTCV